VLDIRELVCSYGKVVALKGLSLSVQSGQLVSNCSIRRKQGHRSNHRAAMRADDAPTMGLPSSDHHT
jgi:hypothetical protein